jgi:hypothetical protein
MLTREKLWVFILAIAMKGRLESYGHLCPQFIDNVPLLTLIFGLPMGRYFLPNVIEQWEKRVVLPIILSD